MVSREEQVAEVQRLAALGLSVRDISKRTGISKSTVDRMKNEGVPLGEAGQSGQMGQDSAHEVSHSSQVSNNPNGTVEDEVITVTKDDDAEPF